MSRISYLAEAYNSIYLEEVSFDINPKAHKDAQKTQKLFTKGARTDNPHEKKTFLNRTGPQLPEEYVSERELTAAEKKKREDIAQSMNLADFEKRYPGRGMEVKMATATKQAKRVAEELSRDEISTLAAKAAASGPKKRKLVGSIRKNSTTFKPSSPEEAKANKEKWNSYWEKNEAYDFVVESLLEGGFAEHWEAAESILECMSDTWLESILEDWKPVSKNAINKMSKGKGLGDIETGDTVNKARYTHKKGEPAPSSTTLRKRLESQAAAAGSKPHRGQTGGMKNEYSAAAADAMLGNNEGPAAKALKSGDTSKERPHTQYYLNYMKSKQKG